MKKSSTLCLLAFLIAIFVLPFKVYASNGEPDGNPIQISALPDSIALAIKMGHCLPIIVPVIDCATHTIELSAWINWIFTGIKDPIVATWSTGQLAHKITVIPPGAWIWDASITSCEPNHWDNTYTQLGTFYQGSINITGPGAICPNSAALLTVNANGYVFNNYTWTPENSSGSSSPYEIYDPGTYTLQVLDDLGCPFTDQISVPLSPAFSPTISGPASMNAVGETAVLKVNEIWNAYLWNNGATTNSIIITEPGAYEVTVTNQFGCTGSAFIAVQENIPPPWTIVPTSRNHTIIIPDTLKFDALGSSLQAGDQIGVFYDSASTGILKCGGFAVWSGLNLVFPAYGSDVNPPAQNGFNTGELFKVKVWRASSNQIFDATAQYAALGSFGGLITRTSDFADDGVSMITSITEGITQAIILNSGWNMISSYLAPVHPDMLEVFEPIASSVDIIKDGDGKSCIPIIPINVIGNWNVLKGYQVRANRKDTLMLLGHKITPQTNPIPLHTGWQIISYLRESPQNIDTAFKTIKTQISLVKNNDGKIYSPQFGINQIGNMLPGQGYKVKALSNVTLTYRPNFTGAPVAERAENPIKSDLLHFALDSNLNTGNNAIIILTNTVAQNLMDNGDEIGVFTPAGVLCGAALYQEQNLAITVWGDDPGTGGIFEGMKNAEAYKFKVWDSGEQKECNANVTFISGTNAYTPDAIEVIQSLAFGMPTYHTITAVSCDEFILNNQTYTSSGIYTQILVNSVGCDSTITLNLTINPIPSVTVSTDQVICSGQTAVLTANGADAYLWSNGETSNTITVSPDITTSYTVTGITAGCTSFPTSIQVSVNLTPSIPDLGNNINLPAGDSIVLDANCSGCQSYQWSTGETTSGITVHSMGTYSVTVSTQQGCTAEDNVLVLTTSTLNPDADYSISIAPNPAQDKVFITCSGASTSMVQVIDPLGKIVLMDKTNIPAGITRTLNLKALPEGSYFIRIAGDGFVKAIKIIKD